MNPSLWLGYAFSDAFQSSSSRAFNRYLTLTCTSQHRVIAFPIVVHFMRHRNYCVSVLLSRSYFSISLALSVCVGGWVYLILQFAPAILHSRMRYFTGVLLCWCFISIIFFSSPRFFRFIASLQSKSNTSNRFNELWTILYSQIMLLYQFK